MTLSIPLPLDTASNQFTASSASADALATELGKKRQENIADSILKSKTKLKLLKRVKDSKAIQSISAPVLQSSLAALGLKTQSTEAAVSVGDTQSKPDSAVISRTTMEKIQECVQDLAKSNKQHQVAVQTMTETLQQAKQREAQAKRDLEKERSENSRQQSLLLDQITKLKHALLEKEIQVAASFRDQLRGLDIALYREKLETKQLQGQVVELQKKLRAKDAQAAQAVKQHIQSLQAVQQHSDDMANEKARLFGLIGLLGNTDLAEISLLSRLHQ
ncbi:hypothetical protein HDV03_000031 [Kappamyces sp. JEL0829]|nr:hypothetical protein HDV03_000031 [Kappamyces sp. JEL0829]